MNDSGVSIKPERKTPPRINLGGVLISLCYPFAECEMDYLSLFTSQPASSIAACAAASRATGILFGEQET